MDLRVGRPAWQPCAAGLLPLPSSALSHSPDVPLVGAVLDVVAERLEHARGGGDGAAVEHLEHTEDDVIHRAAPGRSTERQGGGRLWLS